jgi:hypothetical protein
MLFVLTFICAALKKNKKSVVAELESFAALKSGARLGGATCVNVVSATRVH